MSQFLPTGLTQILSVYTTKDTAPASSAFSPTVTTNGVRYTLSGASTDLKVGDWLVDLSQNTVRQVVAVKTNTTGNLSAAFPSDLVAATVNRIEARDSQAFVVSVAADKGGDITVNGTTISSGSSVTFETPALDAATGSKFVTPVVVDGSVNNATVLVMKR